MVNGFTFGKFLPFHLGHVALIKFAQKRCTNLTVLVCASDKESISGATRVQWIENEFKHLPCIKVQLFQYSESFLTNTSHASKVVSKQWSDQFKLIFPDANVVFTSEKYGEYVADYMNIQHVPFDPDRVQTPISSSLILKNLKEKWKFLSFGAKSHFIKKIVILGTESTGKSTLAGQLAQHYRCSLVEETGRVLVEHSNLCTLKDLINIAQQHTQAIKRSIEESFGPLLILDTNIITTQSYADFLFQTKLSTTVEQEAANAGDVYLYLNNDCPYHQDGTRLNVKMRNKLHWSQLDYLEKRNIPYCLISGSWENRMDRSVQIIDKLMRSSIVR